METSSAVIVFIFLIEICYIIYDSIPSKYTKLEDLNMKSHHYILLFMVELAQGKYTL